MFIGKIVHVDKFPSSNGSEATHGHWVVVVYIGNDVDERIIGAGISTIRQNSLPENSIELLGKPNGCPQTGLMVRSALHYDWLNFLTLDEMTITSYRIRGHKLNGLITQGQRFVATKLAETPPCNPNVSDGNDSDPILA